MAIEVRCPSCGTLVRAPDDAEGKIGRCPKCHERFRITAPGQRPAPSPAPRYEPPAQAIPQPEYRPPVQQPPPSPAMYGPAPQPPAPQVVQQFVMQGAPARTSALAVWSMVLGLVSLLLCGFLGPLAFIFGIAGVSAINRSRGHLTGKGMAITGIILGALELVPLVFILILFFAGVAALPFSLPIVPHLADNESVTIGSLKTVATQEAIFRQQCEVDQDGNGAGEYGLLGEMAGEICVRYPNAGTDPKRIVNPAYLSQQFRTGGSAGQGYATKSGYHIVIYLCATADATTHLALTSGTDRTLGGTAIAGGAGLDPAVPAQMAAIPMQETSFAAYAWPEKLHSTGTRAFFINEAGEVYATKMEAKTYDGASGPAVSAAFTDANNVFKSPISAGKTLGADGNQWQPAQ